MNNWTEKDSVAASAEGWDLFQCTGAADGSPQVQRIDDDSLLLNEQDAWRLVGQGQKPHHLKARQILLRSNPREYQRVMSYHGLPSDTRAHRHYLVEIAWTSLKKGKPRRFVTVVYAADVGAAKAIAVGRMPLAQQDKSRPTRKFRVSETAVEYVMFVTGKLDVESDHLTFEEMSDRINEVIAGITEFKVEGSLRMGGVLTNKGIS